jgi:hypothetical protein
MQTLMQHAFLQPFTQCAGSHKLDVITSSARPTVPSCTGAFAGFA